MNRSLAQIGHWMRDHGHWIRRLQWAIVLLYAFLVLVPVFLPLPDEQARILNHLTLFAQFVFWGIWWPFVLISMVLVGRVWCGVLCPEGALTEWASRSGQNRSVPRWMRWQGWPFVAFALTTIYGQLVSVYQYPKAVLLVLGGSTVAAIAVGYLYGREKRVWCKYLCPVNGVFSVLARLAPLHMKVDRARWEASDARKIIPINCAPLVALRHMEGAEDCHVCGRCSEYRDAITLSARAPNHEIVELAAHRATGWQTLLIIGGLLGIAMGAFHWSASPWFVALKQWGAEYLVEREIFWPLDPTAPWWLLTNYPSQNDRFSWLDGGAIVVYIMATALVLGGGISLALALASRILGPWQKQRFYHLAQALTPIAGCGVFLGLSALTISLLRAEHIAIDWVSSWRVAFLVAANAWSAVLAARIIARYHPHFLRRLSANASYALALAAIDAAWWLMFWGW